MLYMSNYFTMLYCSIFALHSAYLNVFKCNAADLKSHLLLFGFVKKRRKPTYVDRCSYFL